MSVCWTRTRWQSMSDTSLQRVLCPDTRVLWLSLCVPKTGHSNRKKDGRALFKNEFSLVFYHLQMLGELKEWFFLQVKKIWRLDSDLYWIFINIWSYTSIFLNFNIYNFFKYIYIYNVSYVSWFRGSTCLCRTLKSPCPHVKWLSFHLLHWLWIQDWMS